MHKVGLQPETGLAAAGAADHQHVFVPGRPGVLGAATHGQALRGRQDDVVVKNGIDVWRDVLCRAPAGRAVFLVFPKLPGILSLDVNRQSDHHSGGDTHTEIDGMKAGSKG